MTILCDFAVIGDIDLTTCVLLSCIQQLQVFSDIGHSVRQYVSNLFLSQPLGLTSGSTSGLVISTVLQQGAPKSSLPTPLPLRQSETTSGLT